MSEQTPRRDLPSQLRQLGRRHPDAWVLAGPLDQMCEALADLVQRELAAAAPPFSPRDIDRECAEITFRRDCPVFLLERVRDKPVYVTYPGAPEGRAS